MNQTGAAGKAGGAAGRGAGAAKVAIGMMSGTSMDGIDLALIRSDGEDLLERGAARTFTYDKAFRERIAAALPVAATLTRRDERPGDLAELERELTLRHARALRAFLRERSLRLSDIDLIGFHGQTVLHRPQERLTVQLGDGALLAAETGLPVVHDMRQADIAAGGQGAPLVPAYHLALARNLPPALTGRWPVAFVNIGGISNITGVSREGQLVAFDSGPGNALIDQWIEQGAGIPFDQGGAIASEGAVIPSLAARYLDQPFFSKPAPKSLDRSDFQPLAADEASLADGARTLAHVAAAAVVKGLEALPAFPALVIVCGGGRHNRIVMDDLAAMAGEGRDCRVVGADEAGLDGDATEAEAWAYLAIRSARGLPLSWPGTTGVPAPMPGGVLSRPGAGALDEARSPRTGSGTL